VRVFLVESRLDTIPLLPTVKEQKNKSSYAQNNRQARMRREKKDKRARKNE
jgi:hypothetical protein